MQVRMTVGISGLREGQAWPAIGGEIELPEDEALSLIANKYAEEATAEAAAEVTPAETPAE